MENLRYVIVSSLYIAILLSFRSLRYYRSTKNCYPKSTPWKIVIFGVKVAILMKNRKKNGKSQIRNSFFLIHCSFIIILKLKVFSFN